ncbi:MAG: acyl carrier protein [Bryobacteraceae bacterium]|jgi:acyl carrier protein
MNKDAFYLKMDELLEAAAGTVQGSSALANLEDWNSLAVIGFIAMVDTEYGVSLPAKAILSCRTVDDLAALVAEAPRA